MQGRLKSITLKTSQEAWQLDLDDAYGPAARDVHGQPQGPPNLVPISTASQLAGQPAPAQRNQKRAASTSEDVDDDVFMPPTKQHASARASSSRAGSNLRGTMSEHATSKNPKTMILEVGDEGGLEINELCVKNVIELPHGDIDPPSSTEEENGRALAEFRKSVHVERNKEDKCKHLLDMMRKLNIDNALTVRIFFVVAFNKLLFPALDHNIRGRDAFLTKNLSQFHNINWCKAVVQELRHAAITWRSDKKKSIPGCGIFLIIFYLDNLDSDISIDHLATPQAKYFHKHIIKKLIYEDKQIDRSGNVTYGNLKLKNIAKTCYKYTEPTRNGVSAAPNTSSSPMFPCAEEIGVLLSQIAGSSSKTKAIEGFKQFDAKASQAINIIQSGSQMLVDAGKEFIHTIRNAIVTEPVDKRRDQESMDRGAGVENQSRSNVDFSFGAARTEETNTHHQTTLPQFFGPEPQATVNIDTHIEQQNYEMRWQGDFSSYGHEKHIADVDTTSIDRTIAAVPAQGCPEPTTPLHTGNVHDIQEPRGAAESHVPSNRYVGTQDEVECATSIIATSLTSKDEVIAESATLSDTQEDLGYIFRARPRIDKLVKVPGRYRSPFRCITLRPAIDIAKAHAIRRKICTELKNKRGFLFFGPTATRCSEVAEYFADGGILYKSLMNFFVECIRAEEQDYRPNCVGTRVFLSGSLGEMLNFDEERHQVDYPDLAAFIKLRDDVRDIDIYKVKLFLIPIPENNHYTVYCLNMVDFRIDILDSSNEDHGAYHKVVGDRVVPRLNKLFQDLTDEEFKDFSNWKRPVTRVMRETEPNDSPFISMKILKIWDGNRLHSQENQVNMDELRSEMLYYMLYNKVNEQRRLPYGLEEYMPR